MAEIKRRFSFKRSHSPSRHPASNSDGEPQTPDEGAAYPEQFRGWLLKWTNYIKGYQKRWFVLSNSLLSYYRYALQVARDSKARARLSVCNYAV